MKKHLKEAYRRIEAEEKTLHLKTFAEHTPPILYPPVVQIGQDRTREADDHRPMLEKALSQFHQASPLSSQGLFKFI